MAWTTKAPLPAARQLHAVAATATRVYAVGGSGGATNYEYDPTANTWATKASLPSPRDALAAGSINGKVYAVGGWNSGVMATNYEYDPVANTWTTRASMPTARRYLAAAVLDGKLYAIGGLNSSGTPVTTVEMYDPVANTWTTRAPLPAARSSHAAAAAGGKLYVVGGFDGSGAVATVYEYDPTANMWTTKATMPTARRDLAAGAIGGSVFAVGGSVLATVEAYSPASNTWAAKTAMPTARNLAGAALDGIFYAVGGYNGATLTTVEAGSFNAAPNAPILTAPADGSTIDRNITQRFDWDFSDPDTGDSQSKYDLRYRVVGTSTWTEVTGTTPNTFHDLAAGTFSAGDYEWQVRTYDAQGAVGPYSGSSFFTAATAPSEPTITDPINGATVGQNETVTWSAPDQAAYQLRRVADNAGAADTATVYEDSGEVVSATARSRAVTFATNDRYEHVQVRIKDNGLWSAWASVRVQVSWTPPPTPVVSLLADDDAGSLIVTVTNPAPGAGEPAVSYNDIFVDDGNGEFRAATMVTPNTSWTYHLPVSGRDYAGSVRVEAVADNGITASS